MNGQSNGQQAKCLTQISLKITSAHIPAQIFLLIGTKTQAYIPFLISSHFSQTMGGVIFVFEMMNLKTHYDPLLHLNSMVHQL